LHIDTPIEPDPPQVWRKAVLTCRTMLGSGFLVAFNGSRGTGKTRAAVSVMKQACLLAARRNEQHRRPALYAKTVEFYLSIRAAFGKDDRTEADTLRPYQEVGLLVLDEIQERGATEWEDRILNYVIDKRYDNGLDTILISNLKPEDFSRNVGPSISSRIVEKGELFSFTNPSFRKPKT